LARTERARNEGARETKIDTTRLEVAALTSLFAAMLLGAASCTQSPTTTTPPKAGKTPTTTSPVATGKPRIMVVMMENKNYSEVIGNAAQPYVNSLASDYGSATNSHALAHPSLPNYLDIVSGSNQGVTDDNDPSSHSFPGSQTLADQLAAVGVSEKAYAEDLPSRPALDAGLYAVRHVPWEYFPGTRITLADASTMTTDLDSANPPDFVWYTPNLTDDEHTGVPVDTVGRQLADGESFLSKFVPSVQATAWYNSGGVIIIEWDEAEDSDTSGLNGGAGGHIPTIVVSNALKSHPQRDSTPVDTAGVLRSIESAYGVPYLGGAADPANGNIGSLLEAKSLEAGRSR
jgi:acid phosphatase